MRSLLAVTVSVLASVAGVVALSHVLMAIVTLASARSFIHAVHSRNPNTALRFVLESRLLERNPTTVIECVSSEVFRVRSDHECDYEALRDTAICGPRDAPEYAIMGVPFSGCQTLASQAMLNEPSADCADNLRQLFLSPNEFELLNPTETARSILRLTLLEVLLPQETVDRLVFRTSGRTDIIAFGKTELVSHTFTSTGEWNFTILSYKATNGSKFLTFLDSLTFENCGTRGSELRITGR